MINQGKYIPSKIAGNFIDSTVFKDGVSFMESDTATDHVYIVLYNNKNSSLEQGQEILAASSFINRKVKLVDGDNNNGLKLQIATVTPAETVDLAPSTPLVADRFAIVRTQNTVPKDCGIQGAGEGTTIDIPDLSNKYDIIICGEIDKGPVISENTNFQFNASEINFVVTAAAK